MQKWNTEENVLYMKANSLHIYSPLKKNLSSQLLEDDPAPVLQLPPFNLIRIPNVVYDQEARRQPGERTAPGHSHPSPI